MCWNIKAKVTVLTLEVLQSNIMWNEKKNFLGGGKKIFHISFSDNF